MLTTLKFTDRKVSAADIEGALPLDANHPTFAHFYGPKPELVVKIQRAEPGILRTTKAGFQVNFPNAIFGYGMFKKRHRGGNVMLFDCAGNAARAVNAFFFSEQVHVGDIFSENINQGDRDCEVVAVKKTRYRIEFEMPNCVQGGWRHGVVVCDKLYY